MESMRVALRSPCYAQAHWKLREAHDYRSLREH
jgi:hypothetical protein